MFAVGVISGKGGCGKSTVAANIALELKTRGVRVGVLDADLDSPYLVEMAGVQGKIDIDFEHRMVPVNWRGIPVMSFALWRPDALGGASMQGDMHSRWVDDSLRFTDWGETEFLVIDLPAGIGDEYLMARKSLGSKLLGLVAVALPNVVSGLQRVYDASAYNHLRILGVIENMSGEVFGEGTVAAFCRERGLEFFGKIPLDARVRHAHEAGDPALPENVRQSIVVACDKIQKQVAVVA